MKKWIFAFSVAAAIAAVLLSIDEPQLFVSPGKPIAPHEHIAADCFACHTPFLGSRADKCIACHALEDIGIRTTAGVAIAHEKKNVAFHQKLRDSDCVACHSDHRGVRPFRPIKRFSHDLLEAALRDDCRQCHTHPGDSLHRGIEANCGECHRQDDWLPASFDHAPYFRFDRNHQTECVTCHVNADYSAYTCYGCHQHSRSKIREEHLEEGIRDYENCAECHRSGDEDEAERSWKAKRGGADEHQRDERRERDAGEREGRDD